MFKVFKEIKISAISTCVPKNPENFKAFREAHGEEQFARLARATGILKARSSLPDQTAANLGLIAAQDLLEREKLTGADLQALVFVTTTPDETSPPTSHRLHFALGLEKSAPAFDLTFGCSGYIAGLLQGCLLVESGIAQKVLVITAETPRKVVRPDDPATGAIFGDAGAATLVERSTRSEIKISLMADGRGADEIVLPNSASRLDSTRPDFLVMNGAGVFEFATKEVPPSLLKHLENGGDLLSEQNYFVFHQANRLITSTIEKKLKIPAEKSLYSLSDFANTGSASIPLTLCHNRDQLQLASTKKVVLCGFGVGLSWGHVTADLTHTRIHPIVESDVGGKISN